MSSVAQKRWPIGSLETFLTQSSILMLIRSISCFNTIRIIGYVGKGFVTRKYFILYEGFLL